MGRSGWTIRRLALAAVVVTLAIAGASAATASVADDAILNQTQVQDPIGDSGGGPDLSSLTVTTYADGTISFAVQMANRDFLHPGETVQIFVDLNHDGVADLNLSIWPTLDPSYLARSTGTDWTVVRQLPELVQTPGSISVRLSLDELRDAAGVPVAPDINVSAGSWTADPATGAIPATPNDLVPNGNAWLQHEIAKPQPATTTTTTTTTATGAAPPTQHAAPSLALACVGHTLEATVTPAPGSKVASVSFSAAGKPRIRETKAPYVAEFSTRGLPFLTVSVTIDSQRGAQTLHKRAHGC